MSLSVIAAISMIALTSWSYGTGLDNTDPLEEFNISARVDTLNYVPTAFSPNGDGENDLFLPDLVSIPEYDEYILKIYNRWGELLFESNNLYVGWDGTSGKKQMPAGTYVWSIEFKVAGAENIKYNGHVTLLRSLSQ